ARRVISAVGDVDRGDSDYIPLRQLYARSLYKDEDLVAPQKYEQAVKVLERDCDLADSTDGETLGLAGAIYKRLWDHTGGRTHLEQALRYYRKGHEATADADGWLGVNTAYVLDLLGVQERRAGGTDSEQRAAARFGEADDVRRNVLAKLTTPPAQHKNPWYFNASVAEAHFGLGQFDEAERVLAQAWSATKTWRETFDANTNRRAQRETTARQLAAIARIRFVDDAYDRARSVVANAFGISDRAVRALFRGKIGLALSGGGFRASLFHIGVLAKLAELDLLRDVEVISCVSGGSIIGAHYYIELKKRLESGKTTRDDYIELVRDVEKNFRAGVQKNVRTRIAASPLAGLKMACRSGYSRSDRVAELYQQHLYDRTASNGKKAPRAMSELLVEPQAFLPEVDGDKFHPKYDNWRLDAKVPMLVLNATSLNTGHNWQFSAKRMGEPPHAINVTIDAIPRYRRVELGAKDVPEAHRDIPIANAVAASACVPALFEPLVLRGLYPDRTVRLVDGGVHDNQGLASLLEQNCRVILASDASGQMKETVNPGGSVSGAFGGSNGILQARVREAQFDQLSALLRAEAIQGAMFIHLTKELDAPPVPWIGAESQRAYAKPPDQTSYGVDRDIQLKLAAVRTDLDSFSDAEAFALMASGYLMTDHALLQEECTPTLTLAANPVEWSFLSAEAALRGHDDATERMRELLSVSHIKGGKVWHQLRPLKVLGWALLAALVFGVGALAVHFHNQRLPSVGFVAIVAVVLAGWAGTLAFLDHKQIYHKRITEVALGLALATVICAVAWIHLAIFDPLFLRHGRWPRKPKKGVVLAGGAEAA
ncbi:MAG TPA: patatin-like phospholipase family protein, partial [Thermoanaerobaculia bacterium]|nr:patatin-like phospholipase family protein [Thermoanaerobaculia bacterium]